MMPQRPALRLAGTPPAATRTPLRSPSPARRRPSCRSPASRSSLTRTHRGGRVSVGMGLTTRRHTEPGHVHRPAAAPRLVALSRHHGDHFDRIAAAQLDHDLTVITEPRAARKLRSQGFRRPIALSTWESQTIVRGGTLLHDGWVTSPAAIPALTCA